MINFYINDRRLDLQVLVGAQSGAAFFDQLKEHLTGEYDVIFHVGNQRVENRIVLNKTEYRVRSNFVPYDIEGFIAQEKERVTKEQADAHFEEAPTDVYFLSAKSLLNCIDRFPPFNRSELAKGVGRFKNTSILAILRRFTGTF
jgi:hypothetical protein